MPQQSLEDYAREVASKKKGRFRFERALVIEEGGHKRRLTLWRDQVALWGPRKSDPRNCDRCLCVWGMAGSGARELFGKLAGMDLKGLCEVASHPLEEKKEEK